MGNCLVTKLNGVVNNGALEKLGVLKITVTQQTLPNVTRDKDTRLIKFNISDRDNITIKCNGNGYVVENFDHIDEPAYQLKTITLDAGTTGKNLWFANDNYTIEINNKYAISSMFTPGNYSYRVLFHYDDSLKSCVDLQSFTLNGDNPDFISSIFPVTIENVCLKYGQFNTSISYFTKYTSLKTLDLGYTNISGVIDDISELIQLTTFNLFGLKCTITGSLESLIEKMIGNGRSSGTLTLNQNNNGLLTLHDVSFGNSTMVITFSGTGATITKDGVSAATYDGSDWTYSE